MPSVGTTALLATTMTAPVEDLRAALAPIGELCRASAPGAARILGMHLEGPYIKPASWARSRTTLRPVAIGEAAGAAGAGADPAADLAPKCRATWAIAGSWPPASAWLGHTLGSYEDGVQALQRGARGFTHLFNAMTPLHHRLPGMVGAALAHARFAEIIPDLLHVHPGAIRAALRSIPCLYCVTDSTAATGMPTASTGWGASRSPSAWAACGWRTARWPAPR